MQRKGETARIRERAAKCHSGPSGSGDPSLQRPPAKAGGWKLGLESAKLTRLAEAGGGAWASHLERGQLAARKGGATRSLGPFKGGLDGVIRTGHVSREQPGRGGLSGGRRGERR